MHPDRKIGFAMGILLIGVVGALFFRNEPLVVDDVPTVRREKELNEQLRVRDVAVYIDDAPDLPSQRKQSATDKPQWTLRDLLNELHTRNDGVPLPIGVGQHADKPIRPPESLPPLPHDLKLTAPDAWVPLPAQSARQQPQTNDSSRRIEELQFEEYEEYVVRHGDTLSHIAERFLGAQSRFLEIYELNRDRLIAPDRLQIGKAIRIPRH